MKQSAVEYEAMILEVMWSAEMMMGYRRDGQYTNYFSRGTTAKVTLDRPDTQKQSD